MRVAGVFIVSATVLVSIGAVASLRKAVVDGPSYHDSARAYASLVDLIGPTGAQWVMKTVPNIPRLHMVNHVVGDFLYRTHGALGVGRCTDVLTYSCFHGFIAAAVYESGFDEISRVAAMCSGLEDREHELQCYHGMGHGFLEQVGYTELPSALALCDRMFPDNEARERCFDGVFMENAFGPFATPPSDRWNQSDDPLYPCLDEALVPQAARRACIMTQGKGILSRGRAPQIAGDVVKAFEYCTNIPNSSDKRWCFWGITWSLYALNAGNVESAWRECARVSAPWRDECRWEVAQHAYYFGDRSRKVLTLCDGESETRRETCVRTVLFGGIARVWPDTESRARACESLRAHAESCKAFMNAKTTEAYPDEPFSIEDIDIRYRKEPLDREETFYPVLLGK